MEFDPVRAATQLLADPNWQPSRAHVESLRNALTEEIAKHAKCATKVLEIVGKHVRFRRQVEDTLMPLALHVQDMVAAISGSPKVWTGVTIAYTDEAEDEFDFKCIQALYLEVSGNPIETNAAEKGDG